MFQVVNHQVDEYVQCYKKYNDCSGVIETTVHQKHV